MSAPEATHSAGPAASSRDRWRRQLAGFAATLHDWPWRDTLATLRQRFREDRLGLTAGSLTFTTLISLVPLATVMLAVFAAFPMFSRFESALERYLLQSLVPDGIARPVLGALREFAHQASRLGSAGLGVLLLSALALMLTIDRTLNAIWRVRRPRPIAQRVLVYWAAATLGPLALGISLTATSYAVSASRGLVNAMPDSLEALLDGVGFALFVATVAGLFHFVPNTHVRWRHALAGALFVALGFEVARRALGWYLMLVPSYAMVYGAFATVPILLVWVYLGWVIVLLGAVIAAYAPSLQLRVPRRADAPGRRFELALALLRALDAARRHDTGRSEIGNAAAQRSDRLAHMADGRGASVPALAEALRCDPLAIEPVLDALVALDWVGRLDEPGSARHVLLCDPAATPARPLLESLLLEPTRDSAAFWRRAGFDSLRLADLIGTP